MSKNGISVRKSRNFDRNLDSGPMVKQIKKNMWKAEEVLFDVANAIAPIDEGDLRQDTTIIKNMNFVERSWDKVYASVRYKINLKNPQTTYWIKKGEKKTRSKRLKIMKEGVIK